MARDKVMASRAVIAVAKAYNPTRDISGTRTRENVLARMDRLRTRIAPPSARAEARLARPSSWIGTGTCTTMSHGRPMAGWQTSERTSRFWAARHVSLRPGTSGATLAGQRSADGAAYAGPSTQT